MSCMLNNGRQCCIECQDKEYCKSIDAFVAVECPIGELNSDRLLKLSDCSSYSKKEPTKHCMDGYNDYIEGDDKNPKKKYNLKKVTKIEKAQIDPPILFGPKNQKLITDIFTRIETVLKEHKATKKK